MKFALIALALIGATAALNVPQPKDVASSIDEIKDWIPVDDIINIIKSCEDDPEIVVLREWLRGDVFAAAIQVTREDEDVQRFFQDLEDAGVDFVFLNLLLTLLGLKPIQPSSRLIVNPKAECGGWRGVLAKVEELMTLEELAEKINSVADKDKEFAQAIADMSAGRDIMRALLDTDEWQAVIAGLTGKGVNLARIFDLLYLIFGWE